MSKNLFYFLLHTVLFIFYIQDTRQLKIYVMTASYDNSYINDSIVLSMNIDLATSRIKQKRLKIATVTMSAQNTYWFS